MSAKDYPKKLTIDINLKNKIRINQISIHTHYAQLIETAP